MTPRDDEEVENPEDESRGATPEKPGEDAALSEPDRPEPAAEVPEPAPETPAAPAGERAPEPGPSDPSEPTGAAGEDPARPVIDDPDTSDLATPAATVPGRTDSDSEVVCPFCGERMELFLEPGGERGRQEFVEECQACSRDFEVGVEWDAAGVPHVHTNRTQ